MSLEGHEKRIARLEERDKTVDGRLQVLHSKIDNQKESIDKDIKGVFKSLDEIKKGQHSQDLINQKMDFTLESINRERELDKEAKQDQKKDMKKIKWYVISVVGTIGTSLVIAVVRMWIGI